MQVTLTAFLSLDGVRQSPGAPAEDPSGGFTRGVAFPVPASQGLAQAGYSAAVSTFGSVALGAGQEGSR